METDHRQQLLKDRVRSKISLGFYEVFDEEPFAIYVRSTKKVNHILHFLISVITAGLWLPIWLILSLRVRKMFKIAVDESGNVTERRWR